MTLNKPASLLLGTILLFSIACNHTGPAGQPAATSDTTADAATTTADYFRDTTPGLKTGGIQMVAINTPKGPFKVWTKRIGNNPKIKLLLLNGGPGATHEYFECMESFLPAEGIELTYYDQLGCGNSDDPKDTSMWDLSRYVEEPEYMGLLMPNFYAKHILRRPVDQWPEPVNRSLGKLNRSLYVTMQGPSEFGISGKLANWDITAQLPSLSVPTLTIGGQFDTMDPKHMQWVSTRVRNGSYLYCPNGSHMSMYDDQQTYMKGLIKFIKAVDAGKKSVTL